MDTATRWLEIDAAQFRSHFNRRPFLFRHRLAGHPLFDLPRLVQLARELRTDLVEFNAGRIPVSLPDWENTPYTGLTAEDTLRRAGQVCSWMVLKRAEHSPDYQRLVERCLDEVAPLSEPLEPGMREREAAVFVSSPGSVTPYHLDHEINFLLQIRGAKTVSVLSAADREVLSERDLEAYFSGAAIHRNIPYSERLQARATVFELHEGEGVHIPTTDPHWVKNGDGVSISFSASFKTPASLRRGYVYRMNATLRRLGLDPVPWGRSPWRDRIKLQVFRALNRAQRLLKPGDTATSRPA